MTALYDAANPLPQTHEVFVGPVRGYWSSAILQSVCADYTTAGGDYVNLVRPLGHDITAQDVLDYATEINAAI